MRSWKVSAPRWGEHMTVVFADNEMQAKENAVKLAVSFYGIDPEDIKAERYEEADDLYAGYVEIDWYDDDTRTFLVKHGWTCGEKDADWCDSCKAKQWCGLWEDEEQ